MSGIADLIQTESRLVVGGGGLLGRGGHRERLLQGRAFLFRVREKFWKEMVRRVALACDYTKNHCILQIEWHVDYTSILKTRFCLGPFLSSGMTFKKLCNLSELQSPHL